MERELVFDRADQIRATMPLQRGFVTVQDKALSEEALQRRTAYTRSGPSKTFQDSRQQLDELDEMAESKLAQDLFGLPPVFNAETQKRSAKDECSLCQSEFSVVSFLGVGSKEVVCKRCGNSVCSKCA